MKIKRIYEPSEPGDGYRILVDRLWPRGITKVKANLDEWDKDIAPSAELRKWFGHKPELFETFEKRYKAELKAKADDLHRIKSIAGKHKVTLLYAAKDPHINHAVVLLGVLDEVK